MFNEKETITEGVLDYEFELSPRAFYQLNSEQANVLYGEAVKALNPKKMTVSSMLTAVLGRLVLQLPKSQIGSRNGYYTRINL